MKNQINSQEKKITIKDIEVVESTLKSPLPKILVEFYLQYNGCEINKCIKTVDGDIIKIECFFPIKYNSEFNDEPAFTAEGETIRLREASVIPSNMFIFGMESENEGRIAVDLNCKSVYLYPITGMKKDIFVFDTPVLITKSIEYFFKELSLGECDNAIYQDERTSKDERTNKEELKIETSAEKLSPEDIAEFEKATGFSLPATMRKFYLKNNGGMPNLCFFQPQDEDYDEVEINTILPIKYPLSGVQTIEETSRSLWDRDMISKRLLPFAIDSGNNLYALHKKSLAIYYVVMDVWNDALSNEDNFAENSTKIASSFKYFITHLLPEEE